MRHIKVTLQFDEVGTGDVLIAVLSEIGYEGFEEEGGKVLAYIPEGQFDESALKGAADMPGVSYERETIEPKNWNEVWESSFEPVVVDDFCTIKAHFHTVESTTPYEIVITPKMSFGTGHHATTQLVMLAMKDIDFKGKSVLDFGTGTGVLAILATMLGATDVTAIDNDEWSVENAKENIERNASGGIEVSQASLEDIAQREYDVILANINRHILLQYMTGLFDRVIPSGLLVMSGLLVEDESIVCDAAVAAGFKVEEVHKRNGWISITTIK